MNLQDAWPTAHPVRLWAAPPVPESAARSIAGVGAVGGSFFGPVGTFFGAEVGTAAGAAVGGAIGSIIGFIGGFADEPF